MKQETFEQRWEYVEEVLVKQFHNSGYSVAIFDSYPSGYKKYWWFCLQITKDGKEVVGLNSDANFDLLYNGKKLKYLNGDSSEINPNQTNTILVENDFNLIAAFEKNII